MIKPSTSLIHLIHKAFSLQTHNVGQRSLSVKIPVCARVCVIVCVCVCVCVHVYACVLLSLCLSTSCYSEGVSAFICWPILPLRPVLPLIGGGNHYICLSEDKKP